MNYGRLKAFFKALVLENPCQLLGSARFQYSIGLQLKK